MIIQNFSFRVIEKMEVGKYSFLKYMLRGQEFPKQGDSSRTANLEGFQKYGCVHLGDGFYLSQKSFYVLEMHLFLL